MLSHYLLEETEREGIAPTCHPAIRDVFIDACLAVPRALASNAGKRNREDIIQSTIQKLLDRAPLSKDPDTYDDLETKLATIRSATRLACSLLNSTLSTFLSGIFLF